MILRGSKPARGKIFLSFTVSRQALRSTKPPIQWALDLILPYLTLHYLSRTVHMYMPEECSPAQMLKIVKAYDFQRD
jgi:hypothetical protein